MDCLCLSTLRTMRSRCPSSQIPPHPIRHIHRVISDPDEFGDIVSGMKLTVEFQRRQTRPSEVEQFQAPEWALDFGEAHVKTSVQGVLPGGWASLCLVRGSGGSSWNGHTAEQGTLCCVPPQEGLDGYTKPGFEWMTVALPPASWGQCRLLAGLDENSLHRFAACQLSAPQLTQIERQVRTTQRLMRGASEPHTVALASP